MALPKRLKRYLLNRVKREHGLRLKKPIKAFQQAKNSGSTSKPHSCDRCKRRKELKASQRATNKRPTLLKLPAELRNLIWKYALYDHNYIEVVENLGPPAWIMANRQIRHETHDLWYAINDFNVTVHDLDGGLYAAWVRRTIRILPADERRATLVESFDWPNLVKWCKIIWNENDRNFILQCARWTPGPTLTVAQTAHSIALEYADLPWHRCASALANHQRALWEYDRRWATSYP